MGKPTSWETVASPILKMYFEEEASIQVEEEIEGKTVTVTKYHLAKLIVAGDVATSDGGSRKEIVTEYLGTQKDVPYTRKETHSGLPTPLKKAYKDYFNNATGSDITV